MNHKCKLQVLDVMKKAMNIEKCLEFGTAMLLSQKGYFIQIQIKNLYCINSLQSQEGGAVMAE